MDDPHYYVFEGGMWPSLYAQWSCREHEERHINIQIYLSIYQKKIYNLIKCVKESKM
mgnify:FL=1